MSVLDPVRLIRCSAEARLAFCLVFGIVSVEKDHLALSLEGQDMRGDSVKEPAVMADGHCAASKILERLFVAG